MAAEAPPDAKGWVRDPAPLFGPGPLPFAPRPVPPRRVLHLCRSATEACLGAAGQEPPGFAVATFDGAPALRWAEATVFGPVANSRETLDEGLLEALVLQTLDTGEKDVWLACPQERLEERYAALAERRGHRVRRAQGDRPAHVADPFSLFSAHRPATRSGTVASYCELDPALHAPMEVGDELRMACEDDAEGGTQVAYVDAEGWLVGLHGTLPFVLDDDARDRLAEVSVRVASLSWGRVDRPDGVTDVQRLAFEIPADVDALLVAAKLPRGSGGRVR